MSLLRTGPRRDRTPVERAASPPPGAVAAQPPDRLSVVENELHPKALRTPRCFFQTALRRDESGLQGARRPRDRSPRPVLRGEPPRIPDVAVLNGSIQVGGVVRRPLAVWTRRLRAVAAFRAG